MRQIKIAYLMPTYCDIPPKVHATHMNASLTAARHGIWISQLGIQEKQLICAARNALAEEFLSTDCTHALWLDSDITLPHWSLVCLAEIDKPMVSGIYFQKVDPPHLPVIYTKHGIPRFGVKKGLHHHVLQWDDGSYFPIDACGFGCVLISREVFERIKAPWFQITEDGSEDLQFCMKARKFGFEIFADSRVLCGHIGPRGEITYEDYKKHRDSLQIRKVEYNPDTQEERVIESDIRQVA